MKFCFIKLLLRVKQRTIHSSNVNKQFMRTTISYYWSPYAKNRIGFKLVFFLLWHSTGRVPRFTTYATHHMGTPVTLCPRLCWNIKLSQQANHHTPSAGCWRVCKIRNVVMRSSFPEGCFKFLSDYKNDTLKVVRRLSLNEKATSMIYVTLWIVSQLT